MPKGIPALAVAALLLIGAAIEVFAGSDRANRDELASMLAAVGFLCLGVGTVIIWQRESQRGSLLRTFDLARGRPFPGAFGQRTFATKVGSIDSPSLKVDDGVIFEGESKMSGVGRICKSVRLRRGRRRQATTPALRHGHTRRPPITITPRKPTTSRPGLASSGSRGMAELPGRWFN